MPACPAETSAEDVMRFLQVRLPVQRVAQVQSFGDGSSGAVRRSKIAPRTGNNAHSPCGDVRDRFRLVQQRADIRGFGGLSMIGEEDDTACRFRLPRLSARRTGPESTRQHVAYEIHKRATQPRSLATTCDVCTPGDQPNCAKIIPMHARTTLVCYQPGHVCTPSSFPGRPQLETRTCHVDDSRRIISYDFLFNLEKNPVRSSRRRDSLASDDSDVAYAPYTEATSVAHSGNIVALQGSRSHPALISRTPRISFNEQTFL